MADDYNDKFKGLREVPAGEADKRVAEILPIKGSEDVSHLLIKPVLPKNKFDVSDYQPNPAVDWIVDLEFGEGEQCTKEEVLSVFDRDWFKDHGFPTLYGFEPEHLRWTYVKAGDVFGPFDRLSVALKMLDDDEEHNPRTKAELESILKSLWEISPRIGVKHIKPRTSPKEGEHRSGELYRLWLECNAEVAVFLIAEKNRPYPGRSIWDVMMCLGLHWGDMDLFHWQNDPEAMGDQSLFSVWTGTEPYYFIPEWIAEEKVYCQDLIFGFSLPGCAAPLQVFRSMMKAVQYAQKRMGGRICNTEKQSLNEKEAERAIEAITKKLKISGFAPGSKEALYLF